MDGAAGATYKGAAFPRCARRPAGARADFGPHPSFLCEDPMNRSRAFRFAPPAFVPLLLAAFPLACAAAEPVSRSGSAAVAEHAPSRPLTIASPLACADAVFANGLDDASRGVCGTGGVTVYTDRAAFLAALAPGHIENDFADVAPGTSLPLQYADGGFNYTVFTEFFGAGGGLYNGPGYISTDRVDDQIWVSTTIDDAPIGAIGGNVWPSDFHVQPATGTIVLTVVLQDGTTGATETIDSTGPDDFRGFVSTTPIAFLQIEAPDLDAPPPGTTPDRWPTLDNLIIGSTP